ncbi:hypothetical protein [Bradyrhizobium sp. 2TAF24]|uniref:hypothetical protein n=1 Tax=Bradyrhizobium sp. 2TAF24 TaxID=3233011 RepID=UPI003F906BAE
MSEDREIAAMAQVLPIMSALDADERRRVLVWLSQKLAIELNPPLKKEMGAPPPHEVGRGDAGTLDLSTDTIATVLAAKTGPDIILAAAAHLHFVKEKQRFTRQELTVEMRTAPGHFKDTYVNNLSKYLAGLTRSDRLRLVGADTYALSNREKRDLEAKLASAA